MIACRSDLPQWLADQGLRTGVEVGVFRGEFTTMLLAAGLRVYAVDPWRAYHAEPSQERHNHLYVHTCRTLAASLDCTIMRLPSVEAAQLFPVQSLDWVYLDGDHTTEGIRADLRAWTPRVRPGGVLTGHDYVGGEWWEQVKPVVDAWVAAHGGEVEMIGPVTRRWRERGDRCASWLWRV